MIRAANILCAGVALLAVASCNRPDARICETPPTRSLSQASVDAARATAKGRPEGERLHYEADALRGFMADCVHRQAYRLAVSTEDAEKAAQASVDLCEEAITDAASADYYAKKADGDEPAYSLLAQQAWGDMQRRAVGYVVQARAGHCGVPPADYP